MHVEQGPRLGTWRDPVGLFAFLAICALVAAFGGMITSASVTTWYPTLQKPALNPPDWVFGPVWTLLYAMMAVAAWRVWRRPASRMRRIALYFFFIQLALNLLWSYLFFGQQALFWATIEIVVLLAAIIATTGLFLTQERLAGWLLVPYILWVAFASYLTYAIWVLNPPVT